MPMLSGTMIASSRKNIYASLWTIVREETFKTVSRKPNKATSVSNRDRSWIGLYNWR